MENYVAFIPVRGGSKSIPLKNIRKINGRPLVYWTLDAAINCPEIDKVYLCTDSDEIREKISEYVCQNDCRDKLFCIDRPAETATDTASTESAMLYFASRFQNFKHIILIQATSPLLCSNQLSDAIKKYEIKGYDSLLSVVRQKRFCWEQGVSGYIPINYDFTQRPRRQEFDGYFVENGAFYINTRSGLLQDCCRLSGQIGIYEMDEDTYFEVDELSDWIVVEDLLQKKTQKKRGSITELSKNIKMLLTDCDGVLTDGGMYYFENSYEGKKFNTKDGMGVQLLRNHGIRFGIITGEKSLLVQRRAEKLEADECYIGVKDKASVLDEICRKYGYSEKEIAYVGDDLNDIAILQKVGLPCAVADSCVAVKKKAIYVTKAIGGKGAIREVAELLIGNE